MAYRQDIAVLSLQDILNSQLRFVAVILVVSLICRIRLCPFPFKKFEIGAPSNNPFLIRRYQEKNSFVIYQRQFCFVLFFCSCFGFFSVLDIAYILFLPRFFQLLTWTSQGQSVDTTGKSALKLVKLPSLEVNC